MSAIRSITDYVSALKGEEFKELNADKAWRIGRIAVAEILGTAILVGVGCGSLVVFPGTTVSHLNVVLSFGLAVTLSITAFGHISGAFLNPSFGLTAMLIGKLSFPMFLVYTASQCFGATIGLAAVKMVSPIECVTMENGFCVTLPDPLIGTNKALLAEAFMTFCICMVFCSATDDRNQNKGDSIAIKFGLSVAALALSGGKYTGCSMNPARSFAPAFLSSNWDQHWVYWVGPLTGAALAGLLYQIIFAENQPPAHNRKEQSDQQDQTRLETLQATA